MISGATQPISPKPILNKQTLESDSISQSSLFAIGDPHDKEIELKAQTMPTATELTLDAAGDTGRAVVPHVYMIKTPSGGKGTGFLIKGGYLITNRHVIAKNKEINESFSAAEIKAVSCSGKEINFAHIYGKKNLDLVILIPSIKISGGLELDLSGEYPKIGEQLYTWGFPLGFNGPSPLFSTSYLSGFIDNPFKELIVNGSFNNGNSGGALFKAQSNKVIGIVYAKHLPLSQFTQNALKVLAENKSGVVYEAKDDVGNIKQFVESNVVAQILTEYQQLSQVNIGHAICVTELVNFLKVIASTCFNKACKSKNIETKQENLLKAQSILGEYDPKSELLSQINKELVNINT